jgi:hypothetical protein
MKKLIILGALSVFSFSAAAAVACDGMKDHQGSDTQAAKDKPVAKDGKAKKEKAPPGEATKS